MTARTERRNGTGVELTRVWAELCNDWQRVRHLVGNARPPSLLSSSTVAKESRGQVQVELISFADTNKILCDIILSPSALAGSKRWCAAAKKVVDACTSSWQKLTIRDGVKAVTKEVFCTRVLVGAHRAAQKEESCWPGELGIRVMADRCCQLWSTRSYHLPFTGPV